MDRDVYMALGDSITAGHGSTHPNFAFVHYVSEFTKEIKLANRTLVVARSGWTTRDVLQATSMLSPDIWNRCNVVTLIVGGNDLRKLLRRQYFSVSGLGISPRMVAQRLREFRIHLNSLCRQLSDKGIPHVFVGTVYNPLPNFALARQAMDSLNAIAQEVAEQYRFRVIDIHHAFQQNEASYIEGYRGGRLEDVATPFRRPIHPNNAGHKLIAHLIMAKMSESRSDSSSNKTSSSNPKIARDSSQRRITQR